MQSQHRFLLALSCPFLLGAFVEPALAHPGHPANEPGTLLGQGDGTVPKQTSFAKINPPAIDLSAQRTLYIVGYSHLDTQWRWTYPQVIRQFLPETMLGNFKLFEKYPNYVFNFSGSRRYEMMREYYPADYARLKAYVASGQWFPCGSSVDEGDSIVPSLESSVRHTLYGNQFFRREFGVESREYMLPDCFGFPAALPTIIAHNGLRGFSTQKLSWGSAIGIPFKVGNWIGPDGSSITSALDPGAYVADVREDLSKSKYWIDRVEENGKKSGVYTDYHYYGTGDRGGAPNDASVQWAEQSAKSEGPLKVVSSRADDMFRTITNEQKKGLPNYKGELLLTEHSAGSITSQAYMKRWNRKSELLADVAERTSVMANWLGGAPYPTKKLYDSWDLVLGSQMHDMLPGTSLPKAYEFCWNDYILAQNGFAAVAQNGVDVVSAALDTRVQGIPLSIFNPLSVAREDVVEATVRFPGAAPQGVRVVGPDGKSVPTQILGRVGANALKIAFTAKVPSVGFAVYDVRRAAPQQAASALKVTANSLENERFRVQINAAGDISSVFDKKANRETLSAPARLAFQFERPGSFPAWNMDWNDRKNPPVGYVDGPAKIRIVEQGAARVALEIERFSRGSRFVQTVSLAAGAAGDRVDVRALIDWKTPVVSLKATFPLASANPNANYDSQVGVVTRGNNNPRRYEVPQHQWFDLTGTDGKFGASVYNDSKYGSDKPDDGTMRLTLLYTPGVRGDYQDEATQDFGRHEMSYSIAPHQGDWRAGKSVWGAARLNQPLRAWQTTPHAGSLGKTFSLLRTSSAQVQITGIKKAEDSDEIIIRLRELHGSPAQNFKIAAGGAILSAREVDGQERAIAGAKPALQNGVLTTSMRGYGLKAFALKLAAPTQKVASPKSRVVALPFDLDVMSYDRDGKDGSFDAQGRTFPAEELPTRIQSEGVNFTVGPDLDGAKNALAARGQKIALPAGHNRVYLLAAASNGDQVGNFKIGNRSVSQKVQGWGGYIGSFDLRLWDGPQPELAYAWDLNMNGLVPGYTKRDTVAWQSSHRHHPTLGNEHYQRSYIFKYGFDVPKGATSLTLPNNPNIRVFAVTVASETAPKTGAAQPLYDTLDNRGNTGPSVQVVSGDAANQSVQVAIVPGLYYRPGSIRYTLDGSTPTAQSPVYSEPIYISRDTTVRTRDFSLDTAGSNVGTLLVRVNDTTAPALVSASSDGLSPVLNATFSEPVSATAANAASFRIEGAPGVAVRGAKLSKDGRAVTLQLSAPLPRGAGVSLSAPGVADLSPRANLALASARLPLRVGPAVELAQIRSFDGQGNGFSQDEAALPVAGAAAWTINQWVYLDKQPRNLTIVSGFGSGRDDGGQQRFLIFNNNSLYFWGSNVDIDAKTPWDLGRWQMVTVTYDGETVRIYKDGREVKSEAARLSAARPQARLAPPSPWTQGGRFEGKIAGFEIYSGALSPANIAALSRKTPAA